MTNQLVLLGSTVLSPLLFLLRGQMRYWGAMVLHLAAIVASSGIALSVFNGQTAHEQVSGYPSSFFLL